MKIQPTPCSNQGLHLRPSLFQNPHGIEQLRLREEDSRLTWKDPQVDQSKNWSNSLNLVYSSAAHRWLQSFLQLKNRYAVIQAQAPTAVLMLLINMVLMYVLAFR
jgi:hypothetical protein